MPPRIVGVIPAAGYATRLHPLEDSKEVYRVGGRPLIDYVVERMRAVPCDEVRVVTRPDKRDVIEHCAELGIRVIEGQPETLAQSIALGVEGLASDDVTLIGLPDTIWDGEEGFARLVEALDGETDVVLGLFTSAEPERSDVVTLDPSGLVTAVAVKPERPASNLIWGCAAARAGALSGVEGRTWPGERFHHLAQQGRVRAVQFSGDFLDVGTKDALRRAEARFAE
jgi:dTDP-glucose pyrophosphorylase